MSAERVRIHGIEWELAPYGGAYATGYGMDDNLPVVRYWNCLAQRWDITCGGIDREVLATFGIDEQRQILAHLGPWPGPGRAHSVSGR